VSSVSLSSIPSRKAASDIRGGFYGGLQQIEKRAHLIVDLETAVFLSAYGKADARHGVKVNIEGEE